MKRLMAGAVMAVAMIGMLDAVPAFADADRFGELYEQTGGLTEAERAWKEVQLELPQMPEDDSLLEVDVIDASRNRYFIDANSVSVGQDAVIRMTLVTEHRGGARTVTYEGIRCETREYRLYAIGGPDGWTKPKSSRWRPVPLTGYKNIRGILLVEHVCDGGVPRKADAVVKALRYPQVSPN
jgi:hypothetical protein